MTIAIVASGSRGDVQPYIALARGLVRAGYPVRLLTSDDFRPLVEEAGVPFFSTGVSVAAIAQSDALRGATERGNFFVIMRRMQREMRRHAKTQAALLPDILKGCDVLIAGMAGLGGPFTLAEHMQIPIVQAYLFPMTPTRTLASPLTPDLPLGWLTNRPSYVLLRQMIWQSVRTGDLATRQMLGVPPAPLFGPYQQLGRMNTPVLYGFSSSVLPRPADWPANHAVTGYWFLDAAPGWAPDAALADFLADGPPPVYIGFGSMSSRDPGAAGRVMLDALRMTGQRGLIAGGWGGLAPDDLPPTVRVVGSVPHYWLFPRVATVVHHGGAGTTAAGFRAGIPQVLVPHMGDQAFWASRVHRLGSGPPAVPRRQLDADSLARAIDTALADARMRVVASALGQQVRAEDGVAQAITHIQHLLG
jgi:sterol 3beta-glucosyltransferase